MSGLSQLVPDGALVHVQGELSLVAGLVNNCMLLMCMFALGVITTGNHE